MRIIAVLLCVCLIEITDFQINKTLEILEKRQFILPGCTYYYLSVFMTKYIKIWFHLSISKDAFFYHSICKTLIANARASFPNNGITLSLLFPLYWFDGAIEIKETHIGVRFEFQLIVKNTVSKTISQADSPVLHMTHIPLMDFHYVTSSYSNHL